MDGSSSLAGACCPEEKHSERAEEQKQQLTRRQFKAKARENAEHAGS